MKAPEYLAINPMGKVPALRHDDRVVTECAAICTYLADMFPQAGLMPSDRAAFYRWMFFGAGPFEAAVVNKALGVTVPDDKRGMVGYGSFDDVIRTLRGHLASLPYMVGTVSSAADVYLGAQIRWGMNFRVDPERARVRRLSAERIKGRPAAIRARAIDEELAAGNDDIAPPDRDPGTARGSASPWEYRLARDRGPRRPAQDPQVPQFLRGPGPTCPASPYRRKS